MLNTYYHRYPKFYKHWHDLCNVCACSSDHDNGCIMYKWNFKDLNGAKIFPNYTQNKLWFLNKSYSPTLIPRVLRLVLWPAVGCLERLWWNWFYLPWKFCSKKCMWKPEPLTGKLIKNLLTSILLHQTLASKGCEFQTMKLKILLLSRLMSDALVVTCLFYTPFNSNWLYKATRSCTSTLSYISSGW